MANVNPIMTVIVDVRRGGEKEVAPNADNSRQEIGGGGEIFASLMWTSLAHRLPAKVHNKWQVIHSVQ